MKVQIKKKPYQIFKKVPKKRETSSDEEAIPLMGLAKEMQEKGRADKFGNDITSPEHQKSVNEVSSFYEHTKES